MTNSLINVAPAIINHKANVEMGNAYNIPIDTLLADSAEMWVRMKNSNQDVHMFANQMEMGDTSNDIRMKNMLLVIDENKHSAKALTSFYKDIIATVEGAGNPKEVALNSLFEMKPPTLDDVIQTALKKGGYLDAAQIELRPGSSSGTQQEIGTAPQAGARGIEATPVREEARLQEASHRAGEAGAARGIEETQSSPEAIAYEFAANGLPQEMAVKETGLSATRVDEIYGMQAQGEELPDINIVAPSVTEPTKSLPPMEDNYLKPLKEYAPTMYHEAGPDKIINFIRPSHSVSDIDVYMSNTSDLALGQGDNKGFLIELKTDTGIKGKVDMSKPSAQMLYSQGSAEFIARNNTPAQYEKAITAITIKKGSLLALSKGQQTVLKNYLSGWDSVKNPDGSTTYTKPAGASAEAGRAAVTTKADSKPAVKTDNTSKKMSDYVKTDKFVEKNSGAKAEIVKGDPAAAALTSAAKESRGNSAVQIMPESVRRAYGYGKEPVPDSIFTDSPEDQKIKSAMDEAKTSWRAKDLTIAEQISNVKQEIIKNVFRGAVPELDYEHGDLRFQLIRMGKRRAIAANLAEHHVLATYKPLPSEYADNMMYAVLLPDMKEDLDRGLLTVKGIPFNFESEKQVIDKLNLIKAIVDDPRDPTLKNALSRRKMQYQGIKDLYIKAAKDSIGMDAKPLFNRNDYHKHIIIHYLQELQSSQAFRKSATNAFKKREGSASDYVTDIELADFLSYRSMYDDILKFDLMKTVKPYDIMDKVKISENGDFIIPAGFTYMKASDLGFRFPSELVKENQTELTKKLLKEQGIKLSSKYAKNKLREARRLEAQLSWVVPDDVFKAVMRVVSAPPERNVVEKILNRPVQIFKQFALKFPTRIGPYQLRNLSGDLDQTIALLAGTNNPKEVAAVGKKMIKYIAEAEKELRNLVYKKEIIDEDIYKYVMSGSMYSHHSFQTMQADKEMREVSMFNKDGSLITTKQLAKKMTGMWDSVDKFYQYREHILRVAGYKYFKNDVLNNKKGLPANDYYYASMPREIQGMSNVSDKALKMTNDLNVAYDDSPPIVQALARNMYPFLRFTFGNNKRVFREMKNAFYEDPQSQYKAGENYAKKKNILGKLGPMGLLRLGKVLLATQLMSATAWLWNNVVMKDQEKELPDYIQRQPHLVLGEFNGKVQYMPGIGSTGQATAMIGINDMTNDISKVLDGTFTMEEYANNLVDFYKTNFMYSALPVHRGLTESMVGKKLWPTPSNVRDPWEHFLSTYQLDTIYNRIKGKPVREGKITLDEVMFSQAFKGESAFWDIYNYREDYLASIGETPTSFGVSTEPRPMALYYFRTAVRLEDWNAAEKYLKEYANLGGTYEDIKTSARSLNPLNQLDANQIRDFEEWLSDEEKKRYEEGMKYYEKYADDILDIAYKEETLPTRRPRR